MRITDLTNPDTMNPCIGGSAAMSDCPLPGGRSTDIPR